MIDFREGIIYKIQLRFLIVVTSIFRGYTGKKLEDNVDCEIFQVILEEAKSSYSSNIVHELPNTTPENLECNVNTILQWLQQWLSHAE